MSWRLWGYVGDHDLTSDPPWVAGDGSWAYDAQTGNAMSWENLSPEDPPAYGMILDGLRITRQLPTDKPWPATPEIATASFSVVAEAVDDLAELVRRKPVSLYLYLTPPADGTVTPEVWFHGRITDVVIRPHDLGVIADVTCVDYLADLAEVTVLDDALAADSIGGFTSVAMFEIQPWSVFSAGSPGWLWYVNDERTDNLETAARAGAATPALEFMRDTLAQAAVTAPNGDLLGYQLMAKVDVLRPGYGKGTFYNYWRGYMDVPVQRVWRAVPADLWAGYLPNPTWPLPGTPPPMPTRPELRLPGVFGLGPDGYGVVMSPLVPTATSRSMVIPGDYTDMTTSWTQRKNGDPDLIVVTGPWGAGGTQGKVTESVGLVPPTLLHLETVLTDANDARALAQLYLPDSLPDRWEGDALTWYVSRNPEQWPRVPELGDVMTVWPIDPRWNPGGRDYFLGLAGAVETAIVDGDVVATIGLRPGLRDQVVTPAALSWNNLTAGVDWDELNPTDTWDDYRLMRGTST
jgi:hypothetical protein